MYGTYTFVGLFPQETQDKIAALLRKKGIEGDDLEDAMCSRLCDLQENISWEEMQELIKES